MRNSLLLITAFGAFVMPGLGTAAGEAGMHVVNVGQLSQVQSETILFKAQAERAKALNSIESSAPQPVSTVASVPYQQSTRPAPDPGSQPRTEGLPVVSLISGSSRAPQATLLYSSGYEVEAQTIGASLPGGFKLASVSVDGVVLSRDGKLFPLGFSNHAPQQ
ncbi:type IV pilus biogenesis protein PilP [Pseudomonas sp. NPDC088368]|uniref:type IV pilus biogenesis protein PilP n=1 Tax=Pseudomonas sp. NPDC088368 TaxID=3364453 RepID=UPI0038024C0E